jgi:hypothetical protein
MSDKEQYVDELMKHRNTLHLNFMANTLNISKADAENIIFELVGRDIEGFLEGEVFKYTSDVSRVKAELLDIIIKNIE